MPRNAVHLDGWSPFAVFEGGLTLIEGQKSKAPLVRRGYRPMGTPSIKHTHSSSAKDLSEKPCRARPVGIESRHKLSYYEGMPMTSLNISLPEALKDYVEGQVASGDWGTPSEYVRELIRSDKERRLGNLEQELLAAAKGLKIEVPLADIRKKGLVAALRERAHRR